MNELESLEAFRGWLTTAGIYSILFGVLKFGRPVADWLIESRRIKAQEKKDSQESELRLDQQRADLTFNLLEAARMELSQLKEEVTRLRPMESHILHFEEALRHIEALLSSTDPDQRKEVERSAQAFLNRMRRMAAARGTVANEVQRLSSAVETATRAIENRGSK